jgi:hypothetical protein
LERVRQSSGDNEFIAMVAEVNHIHYITRKTQSQKLYTKQKRVSKLQKSQGKYANKLGKKDVKLTTKRGQIQRQGQYKKQLANRRNARRTAIKNKALNTILHPMEAVKGLVRSAMGKI